MTTQVPIVIGMSFGDEGKGTTIDHLCSQRKITNVVRFSGGPQTAHNVVTNDGRHHTFAQFGSGTFQGSGTIATDFMLLNPFNMVAEAEHLIQVNSENPFLKTLIDENALWITPAHIEANRQREINRGKNRHGSCGEGVGETRGFSLMHPDAALRMADMASPEIWQAKMDQTISYYEQEIEGYSFAVDSDLIRSYAALYEDIFQFVIAPHHRIVDVIASQRESIVFEGSQGVLLDEVHGFHPNTTWSDTTNVKALRILAEAGVEKSETETIGVFRTYTTRHGDGAMPSEFDNPDWRAEYPEAHNLYGRWQGDFRGGAFDVEMAAYANQATGGVDSISLTHCDRDPRAIVKGYTKEVPTPQKVEVDGTFSRERRQEISDIVQGITPEELIFTESVSVRDLSEILESYIAPVSIYSYGPKHEDKGEMR